MKIQKKKKLFSLFYLIFYPLFLCFFALLYSFTFTKVIVILDRFSTFLLFFSKSIYNFCYPLSITNVQPETQLKQPFIELTYCLYKSTWQLFLAFCIRTCIYFHSYYSLSSSDSCCSSWEIQKILKRSRWQTSADVAGFKAVILCYIQ